LPRLCRGHSGLPGIHEGNIGVNFSLCSFLLKKKNQKFKTANKFLKLYFIPLKKNNSSRQGRDSNKFFFFNASFHIIFSRNLFDVRFSEPCPASFRLVRNLKSVTLSLSKGVISNEERNLSANVVASETKRSREFKKRTQAGKKVVY